jgi:hypothetical protein
MTLAADIHDRIVDDFAADDVPTANALLERERTASPDLFSDRILRCVVYVAEGDPVALRRAIELARTDYRDLIVWAEYDNAFGDRKRDLTRPFSR